jgi:hypothetical protein
MRRNYWRVPDGNRRGRGMSYLLGERDCKRTGRVPLSAMLNSLRGAFCRKPKGPQWVNTAEISASYCRMRS